MQEYELDSYLGDTEVTEEQRASLLRAATIAADRYRDDDGDAEQVAFAAATGVILGDATVEEMVNDFIVTRREYVTAQERMTGALIAASETVPELTLAQNSGLSRNTIRKALGK